MKVLSTEVYDLGLKSSISQALELLRQDKKNRILSLSDANVMVQARINKELYQIVKKFYWNLPDGMPLVWVLRLKGSKSAERITGFTFFESLIKATSDKKVNHFFCGGRLGVAEKLKSVCSAWGNNNIVGFSSPIYSNKTSVAEMQKIAVEINRRNPDILWVGLGAPKQLYFANEISKHVNVKLIITIGAAFDFHIGAVEKAPNWISKIGMEWFYRLLKEPKRLFKRYLEVIPKFIYYAFVDR